MKQLTDSTLVGRALHWLAAAVIHHRRLFIFPQLFLCGLCIVYTVRNLQFDAKRGNLVGANKKYHQNFINFKNEFPTQDDLVVVVESEDAEKNRQFVERLGARLEAETNLFNNVFYKGDLKMLGAKALLFVPEKDLRELQRKLNDYRPFLEQFTKATNLVSLFSQINRQFRTADREANAENKSMIKALPALEGILRQARETLARDGLPPSPGVTALFNPGSEADREIYITFAGGRIYLVTAQAPVEALNNKAVARLRTLVQETQLEIQGLSVGITGEPVLEFDEMQQSQKDTTLATILSLILCSLLFIYGYQETGRPVKATLCLVVGVSYTMGFATLVVGHLNVLTITFVPMLVGLAIDFGVHLIARYEEELRHGKDEAAALTKAMVFTGQGIFTGAFTTAGAFLAMTFTQFRGIQEMGIICGGGLLVCLVPMVTMLPALLLSGRQNVIDHVRGDPRDRRARVENLWLERPVTTALVSVVLCVLAASQLHKVYFDYNLLHMQSAGLPAVEFEKKLINAHRYPQPGSKETPKSVLFAAIIATNLEHALALEQQITNLPAVANVESITRFLSEDQHRKLGMVGEIKQDLAALEFQPPDTTPVDVNELSRTLYSLYGSLGAARGVVKKDEPELAETLMSLRDTIGRLRVSMHAGSHAMLQTNALKLGLFQQAFFRDLHDTFQALKHQDNSSPLRIEDLPDPLRNRFVGVTGNYLLMVNPRKDVWDRENQKELLTQLRAIDPNVTGTPTQLYEYTNLLKTSYEEAARYSLMAIAIMVFLHFRSLLSVILALLPVAVGSLWTLGLMGYFNIPFNPANIMTLPLVVGIGVTNGIHVLNRFAEEQAPSILARSTGLAVLVSGLTTVAGFGSLTLAKHQGIQSLGWVMSIGVSACMLCGLTLLPAILTLMLRWRRSRNSAKVTQPTDLEPA